MEPARPLVALCGTEGRVPDGPILCTPCWYPRRPKAPCFRSAYLPKFSRALPTKRPMIEEGEWKGTLRVIPATGTSHLCLPAEPYFLPGQSWQLLKNSCPKPSKPPYCVDPMGEGGGGTPLLCCCRYTHAHTHTHTHTPGPWSPDVSWANWCPSGNKIVTELPSPTAH